MIYYQEHILNSLFESESTKAFPERFKEFLKKSDNIDKFIQILDKEVSVFNDTITADKLKEYWNIQIGEKPINITKNYGETLGNAAISIKKIYEVVTDKKHSNDKKERIKNVLGENFFENMIQEFPKEFNIKNNEDLKTAMSNIDSIESIDDKQANIVYQIIKFVYQKIKEKVHSN